jgi:hypothetical protein
MQDSPESLPEPHRVQTVPIHNKPGLWRGPTIFDGQVYHSMTRYLQASAVDHYVGMSVLAWVRRGTSVKDGMPIEIPTGTVYPRATYPVLDDEGMPIPGAPPRIEYNVILFHPIDKEMAHRLHEDFVSKKPDSARPLDAVFPVAVFGDGNFYHAKVQRGLSLSMAILIMQAFSPESEQNLDVMSLVFGNGSLDYTLGTELPARRKTRLEAAARRAEQEALKKGVDK